MGGGGDGGVLRLVFRENDSLGERHQGSNSSRERGRREGPIPSWDPKPGRHFQPPHSLLSTLGSLSPAAPSQEAHPGFLKVLLKHLGRGGRGRGRGQVRKLAEAAHCCLPPRGSLSDRCAVSLALCSSLSPLTAVSPTHTHRSL